MITSRSQRLEQLLFVLHGLIALAASVVLVAFPESIPSAVGFGLDPRQFLMSYFLASAQLGIVVMSFGAAWLDDDAAIRLIAAAFIIFHVATAIFEVVYLSNYGLSTILAINVVLRLAVACLFALVWWSRM